MRPQTAADTQFVLSAPGVVASVEVRLRSIGERWVAVAVVDGAPAEVGIGAQPRDALVASLGRLGLVERTALLADLSLLEPSCEILAAAAGR